MTADMDAYNQSRAYEIYIGTITLMVLASIAVTARLAARKISVANYWWDDYLIALALVFNWALSACTWASIKKGLGRHTVAYGGPVEPDDFIVYQKLALAVQILYFASSFTIKTALILLYYRIFGIIRWFRWLLAASWALVFLYAIVDTFVAVFECKPVAYFWDRTIKGGTCIDLDQFFRWNGVANLLIDFTIWSLTLPVVWRLQLNTRQRLSLSAVFLLGIFACVASIIRVIAFNQLNPYDITYTIVSATTWTTIEQTIGIICASLPTMRPLVGRLLFHIKHISGKGSGNNANAGSGAIPLSDYHSRPTIRPSMDTMTRGFTRLDEENDPPASYISTNASRALGDELPIVAKGIMKHQTLQQYVERRSGP